MSDPNLSVPTPKPGDEHTAQNGYPPMAIMNRMLDIQEQRLKLDSRQLDITENETTQNKELALKSMEYNSKANTEHKEVMRRAIAWRYLFWGLIALLAAVAVMTALVLDKEAFVVEIVKYIAFFLGGYGTKAVVQSRKRNNQSEDE